MWISRAQKSLSFSSQTGGSSWFQKHLSFCQKWLFAKYRKAKTKGKSDVLRLRSHMRGNKCFWVCTKANLFQHRRALILASAATRKRGLPALTDFGNTTEKSAPTPLRYTSQIPKKNRAEIIAFHSASAFQSKNYWLSSKIPLKCANVPSDNRNWLGPAELHFVYHCGEENQFFDRN